MFIISFFKGENGKRSSDRNWRVHGWNQNKNLRSQRSQSLPKISSYILLPSSPRLGFIGLVLVIFCDVIGYIETSQLRSVLPALIYKSLCLSLWLSSGLAIFLCCKCLTAPLLFEEKPHGSMSTLSSRPHLIRIQLWQALLAAGEFSDPKFNALFLWVAVEPIKMHVFILL